jgi:hypothetical protein
MKTSNSINNYTSVDVRIYTGTTTLSTGTTVANTSSSTTIWYKPYGAKFVDVICIGAGGGGGAGQVGYAVNLARNGGGGGASGSVSRFSFIADLLPESVLIGVGNRGRGATYITRTTLTASGSGGSSYFGNFLFSQGGGFGTSPTTAGVGSSNSNFLSGSTGGVGASNIGGFGTMCAIFSTGSTGTFTLCSGGSGGGGGGAVNSATNVETEFNGGLGGGNNGNLLFGSSGITSGTISSIINGGNGIFDPVTFLGSGGGGGAGAGLTSNPNPGGNGGNGGIGGGGGGGGGACSDSTGVKFAGNGGNGGNGVVVVITYF